MHRRTLLETVVAGGAAWVLSACAPPETRSAATPPPVSAPVANAKPSPSTPPPSTVPSAAPPASTSTQALGYVFNTTTQDVTIFNPAARQVVETKPLGVSVTWLSNEQRFWDGQHIWTFDYPQNQVQAIAIDPRTVTVARTIRTGGKVHAGSSNGVGQRGRRALPGGGRHRPQADGRKEDRQISLRHPFHTGRPVRFHTGE